jgi:hypothetical protein
VHLNEGTSKPNAYMEDLAAVDRYGQKARGHRLDNYRWLLQEERETVSAFTCLTKSNTPAYNIFCRIPPRFLGLVFSCFFFNNEGKAYLFVDVL